MTDPRPAAAGEQTRQWPMIVIVGPTASGKTSLAIRAAEDYGGEVISCDSVAVYRGLDIGSAKPTAEERGRIPHHGLDLLEPDQASTAGDYARVARTSLAEVRIRGRLPVVVGGTGLYLRALLDGLAPAPPRDEGLRERLRRHAERYGRESLHRLLGRLDPQAARQIHPNDMPKLIRSLEVTWLARKPQTQQWQAGREPLLGFRKLQLGLDPPRAALYERINARAKAMFDGGLIGETAALRGRFGEQARALGSLGYAQAGAVLDGKQTLAEAVAETQQGHRNYAKRQLTWFRRDARIHWLRGFGDDPAVKTEMLRLVREHLIGSDGEGIIRE